MLGEKRLEVLNKGEQFSQVSCLPDFFHLSEVLCPPVLPLTPSFRLPPSDRPTAAVFCLSLCLPPHSGRPSYDPLSLRLLLLCAPLPTGSPSPG